MSNAVWPLTLPQFVLRDGFQEQAQKNVIKSEMDAGPPKRRRRFTKPLRTLQVRVHLTIAQSELLDEFFQQTLQGGSLPFDWVHPRTHEPMTAFIDEPPTYTPAGGLHVIASFPLEIIP